MPFGETYYRVDEETGDREFALDNLWEGDCSTDFSGKATIQAKRKLVVSETEELNWKTGNDINWFIGF